MREYPGDGGPAKPAGWEEDSSRRRVRSGLSAEGTERGGD
jgi:hypothetical protein